MVAHSPVNSRSILFSPEVADKRSENEMEYLLKAIDAFQRRMIVVSPHFEILAAKCNHEDITDAELVGKLCHQALYDRQQPCENCAVISVIQHGRPALRSKPQNGGNLEKMPCFYAYPIYDGEEIEAFVSMDFDLPTRGEIEAKLQNTNALLRNLILSAVDGVIAADKKGRLLIFNDTASEIFGYTVEEALNELNIIDIYPGNTARDIMNELRSDSHGGRGKLRSYMVDVIDKNGEAIPINLNAAIVYEGKVEVATIGFFHDMREIRQMKENLEKTRIQLLQAEKMSSLFTKLILEEYDLEDGAREDLNRVLKDAKRCKDTVKELLEFTRQTRRLMRPHDINQAITRTLFLLENQSLFQNIEIVRDLPADLPLVQSDIQQLNHLLMNIILNAAQAMGGNGKLTLKTGVTSDGNHVRIEITDTGPGISKDTLPHIFDPFFTTKEEGKGTGLGLSLVYGIIENHGGRIKARNVENQGAIFIIELPLNQSTHGESESE